ncbi:polysaccharide biosynthesis tyrosine autokinase [Psychromonas sp. RZ22]|uniref:GumC family protein n=1 Tax=Psychromonas algarum TaxID=2555643 RepID=UPI001068B27E|nr:polysaccharide biosynthesis tyrosine autokinase [Psychromonas sp. RZ22]TEW56149.1 polysaccharide biosynthesis tyrosine autokinase [Psychromonas sp. RZ22]
MEFKKSISNPPQEQIIDLKIYWKLLIKSKWKILGFAVFTTLLTAVFVAGMQPVYRATTSLLLESDQNKTVSIDTVYSLDTSRKEYFLTQYEILKSRIITEQVIDKLGLAYQPEFLPSDEPSLFSDVKSYIKSFLPIAEKNNEIIDEFDGRRDKVALINTIQSRIEIEPIRKTQLVNISFEAHDPKLAAMVANEIADTFITQGMASQLNSTKKAASWLQDRLEELRLNLENSIDLLQKYRVKENLIDIESKGVRSIASNELESLTQSYLDAKQKRFEAETIALFVSRVEDNDIESLLSLPEISNHESVRAIKRVEIEAEKRYSELSFRYGKKHPKLIAAKAELAAVQKNLQQQVDKLVTGIGKDLSAAKDNERRFQRNLNKEKSKFQVITNKEQNYLKLSHEVESNRNLYDAFLERFKEMNITTDLETQKAQVVDPAEVPISPVKPKKTLLVLIAFAVSFIFAIILTFILNALNDSFRSAAEVESKLGIRLLGLVPLLHLKRKKGLPLYAFFDDAYRTFSEAIRTLRTGFVLSHLDDDHKVVVVTSSVPAEGKTTTAINIAFAMAQMEKTLLIEADMRRPSFTRVFSLDPYQSGLSNVISGAETLNDSIIHDEMSGLDILSAGFIPPNPLELLSSQKFATLLMKLKEEYDHIIIDSPPSLAVSDALVLSKSADSVIYVVRSESTKEATAKAGISRLVEVEVRIDGVVLNRVNIKKLKKNMDYAGYYDSYDYNHKNSR